MVIVYGPDGAIIYTTYGKSRYLLILTYLDLPWALVGSIY